VTGKGNELRDDERQNEQRKKIKKEKKTRKNEKSAQRDANTARWL